MNKKYYYGLFAAGMLFATSCSNDELTQVQSGEYAEVSISLGVEEVAGSRAISDGSGADELYYSVFDADGNRITTIQQVHRENVDFPTTETITLAKGQTYQVAFWAQDNDCEAYTVSDDMNVTVNYAGINNDETRDAFFKTVKFTVNGSTALDVELTRPFAQINVGVDAADWNAAVASGIEIKESNVTIKQAASAINLVTGKVSKPLDVVYTTAAIPNEPLKANNGTYNWLSMSYILVFDGSETGAEDATLTSLEYKFSPKQGKGNPITFKDGLNNVPVKRNWRTNILGKILTGDITFNISIDPIYEGDITAIAKTAEELAAALTADNENINVVLQNDIELPINSLGQITGGSGEYKLGGENTKTITIDLNDHKLNITTTYWSAIGAKNDEALFTIKNGTMTSTGNSAGTWNAWDVRFSNCKYVIENVTFEKEVALDNVGKSTTLKNVTINGTGDKYALWITAEGQNVTIDGLTINSTTGRGIKIDEQYVGTPEKVTLEINNATFNTAKKAAIVVKSVTGAEINASNLNLSGVAADSHFAVWVDEDAKSYADQVIVNGALKAVEGTVATVGNTEDLKAALAADGKSTILLSAGEYTFPTSSFKAGVTVICEEGTVFTGSSSLNINGATVIGATFSNPSGTASTGTINGTFKKCTFSGSNASRWAYANNSDIVFEDCVFNANGVYAIHYDGITDANILYKNCKITGWVAITGGHKSLTFDGCQIYGNGTYGVIRVYGDTTIKNCTFNVAKVDTSDVYEDGIHAVDCTITVENCVNVNGKIDDIFNVSGKGVINKK